MEIPSICSCVAIDPDHSSIIDDAAEILARVSITPPLARHAVGPGRRDHTVPRASVAITSGHDVITPLLRLHLDRARGRKQIKSESRIGESGNRKQGTG